MSKYGERFKAILEKAEKVPAYWLEDLRCQFLDSVSLLMEKEEMSKAELAKKIDVTPAYISKVFNSNVNNFTLKTMVEIAMVFDKKISLRLEPIEKKETVWDVHDLIPTNEIIEGAKVWFSRKSNVSCAVHTTIGACKEKGATESYEDQYKDYEHAA
jgi:predicted XRE-type DNA-binding protein